mgnify:CR=1 FL=1
MPRPSPPVLTRVPLASWLRVRASCVPYVPEAQACPRTPAHGTNAVPYVPRTVAPQVTSLRWTSNDRVLASSSHDGTIHLTESDGRLFDTLRPTVPNEPAAVLPVLSLSWSPGSRYEAAVAYPQP